MKSITSGGFLISCLAVAAACGDDHGSNPDAGGGADAPAADAPTEPTAPPPGIRYFDYPIVTAVSPDGKTVLFEELVADGEIVEANVWLYDTVSGEATIADTLGDPTLALASSVSDNRRVAAQYSNPVVAAIWEDATEWEPIPSPYAVGCEVHKGGAYDLSGDGTVATGLFWNGCAPVAFRWTESGGATPLTMLGTPAEGFTASNRGSVVSRDGKVIAGFAAHGTIDRTAALWHEDGTGELLDPNVVDVPSEALAINADGSVIAGVYGYDGVIWTRGTGFAQIRRFDAAGPTDNVFPNGMTDDGRFIVGAVGGFGPFASPQTAFVWTHRDGMRPLIEVARAAGIVIPDTVTLSHASSVSGDGTVIVGTGTDGEAFKSFVLRLPASAVAR